MIKDLYSCVKKEDWNKFNFLRFSVSNEGDFFVINDWNLSGFNLSDMPMNFLVFKNCNFEGASFVGSHFFPTSFKGCNFDEADFSGASGIAYFYECSFLKVKYSSSTKFVPENSDLPSEFVDCKLDSDFYDFVNSQGVSFGLGAQSALSFE